MDTERTVTRNGTTYQQNTANIGKRKGADAEPDKKAEEDLSEPMVTAEAPVIGT